MDNNHFSSPDICGCFTCFTNSKGAFKPKPDFKFKLANVTLWDLENTGIRNIIQKVNNNMKREQLLELHTKMTSQAKVLMQKKNHDYTEGAEKPDALHNFRQFGAFGIVVRMGDKLSRLESITKGNKMQVAESAEDTLLDLINYSVLLMAYLKEGQDE